MHDRQTFLQALLNQAHPDGGWGYAPGDLPHLEPTCLALLALSGSRPEADTAVSGGLAFLERCALPDGSYRLDRGRAEAAWPTALVLFTRLVLGAKPEEMKPTADRLLTLRGRIPPAGTDDKDISDINQKLVGWPWAEGNFSWTEPTSWACLALRRCGRAEHPHVQEGLRLLLDRTFQGGGINYGNRLVLGKSTEPIPGPTALMLIAMQGHDHEPPVAASVEYLRKIALESDDLEHLCWARLALGLHRGQPGVEEALPRIDERLLAAHEREGGRSWKRSTVYRDVLTALALQADDHSAFRLPEVPSVNGAATPAPPPAAPRPSLGNRIRNMFRGLAAEGLAMLRPLPPVSAVHIARAPDYDGDLLGILRQQYSHFRERVPLKGKRVVLKPNLVEYWRDKVINTDPRVVSAAIELCKEEGAADVIVAEGPGHWRNVEYLVEASGLGEVLQRHGVHFVDNNHDEPYKLPNLGRLTGLDFIYMARTVATADVLISLPRLKAHHWAVATLSMKNMFGTLPGVCYGWPKNELHWRGIHNSIVDICLSRTPDLAIVDGIVAMEGDGPLNGTAKQFGALIMGNDVVATDATCCRLMEYDPEMVGYVVLGNRRKLGRMNPKEIHQLGEPIEALAQPFEMVPHLQKARLVRSA